MYFVCLISKQKKLKRKLEEESEREQRKGTEESKQKIIAMKRLLTNENFYKKK